MTALLRIVVTTLVFYSFVQCFQSEELEELKERCFGHGIYKLCETPIENFIAKMDKEMAKLGLSLIGSNVTIGSRNSFGPFLHSYDDVPSPSCGLCRESPTIRITPTVFLEGDNAKLLMVQTSKFQQTFFIKQCTTPTEQSDSLCMSANENANYGTKFSCRQKFSKFTVLLFNSDKFELVPKDLSFPSACVCELGILDIPLRKK